MVQIPVNVYSEAAMRVHGAIIHQQKDGGWNFSLIRWLIDSKYRKIVQLSDWLKEQMNSAKLQEVVVSLYREDEVGKSDKIAIRCLRWVRNNVTYTSDNSNWNMIEKWQTVDETLTPKPDGKLRADCEDGSILLLLLARKLGVPHYQIRLVAGDVSDTSTSVGKDLNVSSTFTRLWSMELQDFKKEIDVGTILTQLKQDFKLVSEEALPLNFKRAVSLQTKENAQLDFPYVNMRGRLSKIDPKFVKSVDKLIKSNCESTTKTKIDSTMFQRIWQSYVCLVMQNYMEKKGILGNLKKILYLGIKEKTTEGTVGHAWVQYRADFDGVERFLDWCYWYDDTDIPKRSYANNLTKYKTIWLGANDVRGYGDFEFKNIINFTLPEKR
jgi:hypothetical protein